MKKLPTLLLSLTLLVIAGSTAAYRTQVSAQEFPITPPVTTPVTPPGNGGNGIKILPNHLHTGWTGRPYLARFTVMDKTLSDVTISVVGLPAGLSYNCYQFPKVMKVDSVCFISGIPTTAGEYPVTITATTADTSVEKTITLMIKEHKWPWQKNK